MTARMRAVRWSLGGLGVALMALAAWGIVRDRAQTAPLGLGAWLVAGVGLHDLILAPALLLVGAAVVRLVPPRVRAVVVAGLVTAGALVLVGVPVALAARRPRANPSILPLDYWRGLAVSVLVVAVLTGAAALVVGLRRRPGRG